MNKGKLSPCENITDFQMVNFSSFLHLMTESQCECENRPKEIQIVSLSTLHSTSAGMWLSKLACIFGVTVTQKVNLG